jgi:hypothetical protein
MQKKLANIQSSFWRANQSKNASFQWFSHIKGSMTSIEDAKHSRHLWTSKTDESLSMNLLTYSKLFLWNKVYWNVWENKAQTPKQTGFIYNSAAVLKAEISAKFCITTNLTKKYNKKSFMMTINWRWKLSQLLKCHVHEIYLRKCTIPNTQWTPT